MDVAKVRQSLQEQGTHKKWQYIYTVYIYSIYIIIYIYSHIYIFIYIYIHFQLHASSGIPRSSPSGDFANDPRGFLKGNAHLGSLEPRIQRVLVPHAGAQMPTANFPRSLLRYAKTIQSSSWSRPQVFEILVEENNVFESSFFKIAQLPSKQHCFEGKKRLGPVWHTT